MLSTTRQIRYEPQGQFNAPQYPEAAEAITLIVSDSSVSKRPEVYILIIPAFGIISIIISGILQLIIFGNPTNH